MKNICKTHIVRNRKRTQYVVFALVNIWGLCYYVLSWDSEDVMPVPQNLPAIKQTDHRHKPGKYTVQLHLYF